MEKIAVHDANILIDCAKLGILPLVMALPYEFLTTDFVLAELTDAVSAEAVQRCVHEGTLRVVGFDADALGALLLFHAAQARLSLADCSVWQVAQNERGILLSGDALLRKSAEASGQRVHGILWLLGELLCHALVNPAEACALLINLVKHNRRLPQQAVERLKKEWCGPAFGTAAP